MIDRQRFFTFASAAALSLALGHALAQAPAKPEAAAPAPAAAPAAPAAPAEAAAPASSADASRAAMQKRYEEAMAARAKRYEELRQRAAEVGVELPETPPWEQGGMPPGMLEGMGPGGMGMPPGMPEGMGQEGMGMPQMTQEEIQAMREKRWEAMRARAAEQGMELPETPPWEAAQERRKEMLERYEQYRATIEAMTDEQKEAIAALFGSARGPMGGRSGMPCPQYRGYPNRGWSGYGMGPDMRPGMGPGMMMPEMPPQPEGAAPPAPTAPEAAPAAPPQS